VHEVIGGNFRLDALQAAVLRVKLTHLSRWSEARRANADDYRRLFVEAGISSDGERIEPTEEHPIALPIDVGADAGGLTHIYNQFVVRAADRDRLAARLREKSIGNAIYYPIPFHRQECFADLTFDRSRYPLADRAAAEVLALPVYPEMSSEQRARVVEEIAAHYRS
jgi:dTDP-4-amino-4,6-dideoxygalactose transaminase